jgi:adenosylcobyric acid synthase
LLQWVAGERGLDWRPGEESFAAAREAQLEKLGDLVADHVDRDAVMRLIDDGQPRGLPTVRLQASGGQWRRFADRVGRGCEFARDHTNEPET